VDPDIEPRRRPFGVIVVALLQLGTVAAALVSYLSGIDLPWEGTLSVVLAENTWARAGILLFALLVAVAAVGMWRLRPWGLALMISLVGLSLVTDITIWATNAQEDQQLALYLRMAFDVVSAFYLNSSSVQEAFGDRPRVDKPAVSSTASAGRVDP
jgi:hypothetical protein